MNKNKYSLLELISKKEISQGTSLREIAKLIKCEGKPQIVKHHMYSLIIAGFIRISSKNNYALTEDGKMLFEFLRGNKSMRKMLEKLYWGAKND